MKKFFAIFFLFTAIFTTQVYGEINVQINGEEIVFTDQAPVIYYGRTLVPIRAVFEFIGFFVEWEPNTQTVTLFRGDDIAQLRIGAEDFFVNGITYPLDVPAQIIGGRTMLPIRAVMESVGYHVGWWEGTVFISAEPPQIEQIIIPNRELTDEEIELWTLNYHALGGATEFEREVIRLTNIERVAYGLEPVEEYHTLMLAARFKSQSMYDLSYFAHENPVYGHFANIARQVFNKPHRSMGENLAHGHQSPEAVVYAWMESPSHRENILTPNYIRIGVGFHKNRWAQKFSR
jgi:uncharacterized protein YkwD